MQPLKYFLLQVDLDSTGIEDKKTKLLTGFINEIETKGGVHVIWTPEEITVGFEKEGNNVVSDIHPSLSNHLDENTVEDLVFLKTLWDEYKSLLVREVAE